MSVAQAATTVQKPSYQDSDIHKELHTRVLEECKDFIINKKDELGPTKYMIYSPLWSVAWRRQRKRKDFSAKA